MRSTLKALGWALGFGAALILGACDGRPGAGETSPQADAAPMSTSTAPVETRSPAAGRAPRVADQHTLAAESTAEPPVPAEPSADPPGQAVALPPSVDRVYLSGEPAQLADWVERADLHPTVRYASLRRLEELDPARAVRAAQALLGDAPRLLRQNAIALLVRSDRDDARAALAALKGADRRLAEELATR